MAIGNVRPQDPNDQPQEHSLNYTTPPTQELDHDEHNDQIQEENNDQGGD
jgi:hypothetical protein